MPTLVVEERSSYWCWPFQFLFPFRVFVACSACATFIFVGYKENLLWFFFIRSPLFASLFIPLRVGVVHATELGTRRAATLLASINLSVLRSLVLSSAITTPSRYTPNPLKTFLSFSYYVSWFTVSSAGSHACHRFVLLLYTTLANLDALSACGNRPVRWNCLLFCFIFGLCFGSTTTRLIDCVLHAGGSFGIRLLQILLLLIVLK